MKPMPNERELLENHKTRLDSLEIAIALAQQTADDALALLVETEKRVTALAKLCQKQIAKLANTAQEADERVMESVHAMGRRIEALEDHLFKNLPKAP